MILLKLLKDILPNDNEFSDRTFDAKKNIYTMRMNLERIHTCTNDCILYRKDYESLKSCPICGLVQKIRIKFHQSFYSIFR